MDVGIDALRFSMSEFCDDWNIQKPAILDGKHVTSEVLVGYRVYRLAIVRAPSDPSAVAFHTEDEHGNVTGEISTDQVTGHGGNVLDGGASGESVFGAVDHEFKEAIVDPPVNRYADRFDGHEVAVEPCDPVQADTITYKIRKGSKTHDVVLSSYVFPDWFDPQCPPNRTVDRKGSCPGPFRLARGGYQVIKTSANDADEQFRERARKVALEECAPEHRPVVFVHFDEHVPEWKRERIKKRAGRRVERHRANLAKTTT